MDKGHYFCDVLDYNTGTWCNFDDVTITKYSGYPKSVYDNLSIDKNRKRVNVILDGSDRIVSMLYIKTYILESRTYSFITGKSVSKEMEHIKGIIADSVAFK